MNFEAVIGLEVHVELKIIFTLIILKLTKFRKRMNLSVTMALLKLNLKTVQNRLYVLSERILKKMPVKIRTELMATLMLT